MNEEIDLWKEVVQAACSHVMQLRHGRYKETPKSFKDLEDAVDKFLGEHDGEIPT